MKKILFVMPDLIPGGAERIILNLLNNLPINQFQCEIVMLNYSNHKFATQILSPIKIYNLNINRFRHLILKPYLFIRILNISKPDIVFSGYGELNSFIIIFSFLFKKIKFVARETSIPSLRYESILMKYINKILYKYYDKIIVQSDSMLDDLLNNFNIKKHKLIKIKNVIDTNFIDKNLIDVTIKNKNKEIKSILYVGSLSKHKGIIRIIQFFNVLCEYNSNLSLTIIGDGPYRDNVINEIINSPFTSKIELKKWEINPYLSIIKSDYLIIASDYEGFPNVGLEANYCGVPVLVSNETKGGAKELIVEGLNGYVIDMNSTNFTFLNNKFNPLLIKEHVLNNYSVEIIIQKYLELFKGLYSEYEI